MVMRATITTDINNYTVSQKREPLYFRPQLHEMLANFQNCFTGGLLSKFLRKSLLTKYTAIHLKHVATIPSAIIIDVQILDFLARQIAKGDFVQHLLSRATHTDRRSALWQLIDEEQLGLY